jgi:hypothetical protein
MRAEVLAKFISEMSQRSFSGAAKAGLRDYEIVIAPPTDEDLRLQF